MEFLVINGKELSDENRVGWICTRGNRSGWNVFEVTQEEKLELGCTHRLVSFIYPDRTTVVRIKDNKLSFLDNQRYLEGRIKYRSPVVFSGYTDDSKEGRHEWE